jgi:2-oxoglutarate dehydrogenase E2 component (dihydrolipoamide succinyltransferase)
MGVSVSEGTVTKWLRQVGDAIGRDEPLLEISTDKVDTEVPSPGEGVVAQILHQEGETVEVGTVLAVIAPAGAAVAETSVETPPEPATQEAADAATASSSAGEGMTPAPVPTPEVPTPAAPTPVVAVTTPIPEAPPSGNGKTFVSPVVARIAAEHSVDPNVVPGTGQGGRVTKKDILAFIEREIPVVMTRFRETRAGKAGRKWFCAAIGSEVMNTGIDQVHCDSARPFASSTTVT